LESTSRLIFSKGSAGRRKGEKIGQKNEGRGRIMQCCGSWMFIPDPDFYPSRIPQKQQQKRGVKKKFVVIPFFVATDFTNL
jgi:hypothetical protein